MVINSDVPAGNSGHASSTSHGDAGAYQASWDRLMTGEYRLCQPQWRSVRDKLAFHQ